MVCFKQPVFGGSPGLVWRQRFRAKLDSYTFKELYHKLAWRPELYEWLIELKAFPSHWKGVYSTYMKGLRELKASLSLRRGVCSAYMKG